jgi:hypothetical protein
MALIFGVVAVFFVVLFALQRSDLDRAAGRGAAVASRAVAEAGSPRAGRAPNSTGVEDPTAIPEPQLWAALAVAPIDADALRARDEMWDVGRRSLRLGMVVVVLVFLTVPPIYLLESFVPLLIGGPLIALVAIFGAFRAIGPGGEVESGYERTDRAMKPLGLQVSARPQGGFEMRYPSQPGFDYRLRGWTELSGERHGRRVTVRLGGHEDAGTSAVNVVAPGPEWSARSREGRVRPGDGAPEAVAAILRAVPGSERWKRVTLSGGPEGIVVTRKKGQQGDWLCDLWLAERLAEA